MPFIEDEDLRIINDPFGVVVNDMHGFLFVAEESCDCDCDGIDLVDERIVDGADGVMKVVLGVVGIAEV